MQMFIHIAPNEDAVAPILSRMMEEGFHGASVFDCEGMLSTISQNSVDAPEIFGSLRKFVNPDREKHKMIMLVINDERIQDAVNIIHEVCGSLKAPNTGIMFTVPITRWEGIDPKK